MRFRSLCALVVGLVWATLGRAQDYGPSNGPVENPPEVFAFTQAHIFTDYQTLLEDATLVIEQGKVLKVGKNLEVPPEAKVIDLKGRYLYPAFLDVATDFGIPKPEGRPKTTSKQQLSSTKKGPYHYNVALHPEVNALEHFDYDPKAAKKWRKLGFGALGTHRPTGIMRGTGLLTHLSERPPHQRTEKETAFQALSFKKGVSKQSGPKSLMGSIARLEQTYLDAEWYQRAQDPPFNKSLEALNQTKELPGLFYAENWQEVLTVQNLAQKFDQNYWIRSGGDSYQRLQTLKEAGARLVVPLNFPKAYDVSDPLEAQVVPLSHMKHWELAPTNPARLAEAGIPFCLTSDGLKKREQFHKQLIEARRHGLSHQAALKALTHTPAQFLQVEKKLGQLKPGFQANFLVCSDSLFQPGAEILETWVQGQPFRYRDTRLNDWQGTYHLELQRNAYQLTISGKPQKPQFKLRRSDDSAQCPVSGTRKGQQISLKFRDTTRDSSSYFRLSGVLEQDTLFKGRGQKPNGDWFSWEANRLGDSSQSKDPKQLPPGPDTLGQVWYPNLAYGWEEQPRQENVVFRNATVWTNEEAGILEEADVWLRNGKIEAYGQNLKAPNAREIDAEGMHLTSGIIDEHSHICIRGGVNEWGQNNSAEVSIGKVVDAENIQCYRHLAGGVTAAQLLHGSANPIGGQSALVKMRWGELPEAMKIQDAPGFIKFALGENVKQSNFGPQHTNRYPQSRMGVEQVYYDAFLRARAYEEKWGEYRQLSRREQAETPAPRRDLELETLLEILNSKRFVSCHSYVQSEVNMLMHVADSLGFTLNTFTHILEGYKVADKMAEHGAAGSTFSDWWAYKMEVTDAIPYNAALMHSQGVLTAINSDNAEMARRLNHEAAKVLKYSEGQVSEEEAWKMITLNPAKMLHLDHRMGSLEPGKDADVVLWNRHPLSVAAKAQKTYVDGRCYFDRQKDRQLRQRNQKARNRLIQKMLKAKAEGQPTQKAQPSQKILDWECEDLGRP